MFTQNKIAGVIGGMGPAATIDFMSRVMSASDVRRDQDHLRMLVDHNPAVPSRQAAMRGEGESPGPVLASMARGLEASGADFIVMPCNLAHFWQTDIEHSASIPFLSIVDASVAAAIARSDDNDAVGILTTPGCQTAGLYQHAFATEGRKIVLQTKHELATAMAVVEGVKLGDRSEQQAVRLRALAQALLDRGATLLLAACTEFPLLLKDSMFDVPLISSTDELAKVTVANATALAHKQVLT